MWNRILLLASASLLLSACAISTPSSMRRTPPEECVAQVAKLNPLAAGTQAEEELWITDAAPKYQELRKNYECLRDWSADDADDEE